jgi:hypothetical protein
MKIQTNRLYHVTPGKNSASIHEFGLLPAKSTGKRKVVWMCEYRRLTWAFAHISAKKAIPVSEMVVCVANVETLSLSRTRWPEVFVSHSIVPVYAILTAKDMLREIEAFMREGSRTL